MEDENKLILLVLLFATFAIVITIFSFEKISGEEKESLQNNREKCSDGLSSSITTLKNVSDKNLNSSLNIKNTEITKEKP